MSAEMQELPRGRLILATAGVMVSLLLAALDQTIIGTALPRIVAELQGLDYYAWVTTAYLVASTTMTPIAGKLGDLFGRKPFLLVGIVGFVLASALCGQAQSMLELVVFRGIQGLFGGLLFATVFTVIADLYQPQTRAKVQGLFGAIFGLSSVLGPTIGGYLTDGPGWRWVFYVNVPVGIVAVAVVMIGLPYVKSKASWRDIDFLGAFALTAGLVPLLVGLSITRDHAWNSTVVLGLLGLAAVALAAFFMIERRVAHPIVPFELFKNRVFSVSVVVSFLTAFGMFGTIIFVPLVFQGVLGIGAANSGQLITPLMFGLIVASVISGQLMTRMKYYRWLGTGGILIMIAGMYLLSEVNVNMSRWEVVRDLVVIGLGLGVTFPLYINAVQSALPRQFLGVASSQIQFWRNVGGTVSTAILGAILSNRLPENIKAQIGLLGLPPRATAAFSDGTGSGSPQSLFDPNKLAQMRAQAALGGPQAIHAFDQIIAAVRTALAMTLHDLFLIGAAIMVVSLVASVFMKEVPLTATQGAIPELGGENPVPEVATVA